MRNNPISAIREWGNTRNEKKKKTPKIREQEEDPIKVKKCVQAKLRCCDGGDQ